MKARITKCEVYDGLNMVNGRFHGSKWKDRWEVTFVFDSKDDAEKFAEAAQHGDADARPFDTRRQGGADGDVPSAASMLLRVNQGWQQAGGEMVGGWKYCGSWFSADSRLQPQDAGGEGKKKSR